MAQDWLVNNERMRKICAVNECIGGVVRRRKGERSSRWQTRCWKKSEQVLKRGKQPTVGNGRAETDHLTRTHAPFTFSKSTGRYRGTPIIKCTPETGTGRWRWSPSRFAEIAASLYWSGTTPSGNLIKTHEYGKEPCSCSQARMVHCGPPSGRHLVSSRCDSTLTHVRHA